FYTGPDGGYLMNRLTGAGVGGWRADGYASPAQTGGRPGGAPLGVFFYPFSRGRGGPAGGGGGPHDAATPPPRSERIAELIPAARLHTLADCGHTSSLEQPAAVTALLQEFLATIDGPWTD
ncbi:alpha/beta fold hydrolase, partial [Nocardia abscessus]|uniref:alpha/beta fold hydrolase n=1 Tax=Nocardia abscessus TaxID=120957 RepID=UPI003CC7E9AB